MNTANTFTLVGNQKRKSRHFFPTNFSKAIIASFIFSTASAEALTISNGSLSVDISTTTGAIDTLSYGGTDWYNPGTPVSDWGLQSGTNTSSFAINTTTGSSGIPINSVTLVGGAVNVNGSYTSSSGVTIGVNRSYSLIDSFDALYVKTTLSKATFARPGVIRLFETFDPDMARGLGGSYHTYMDVKTLSGYSVTEAWVNSPTDLAVVMGTANVLASGNPFQVSNGNDVNTLFDSPYDANGAYVDRGMHLGFEANLNSPVSSVTFSYVQAYGTTLADAESTFTNVVATPVPASAWLFGSAMLGLISIGRKRR